MQIFLCRKQLELKMIGKQNFEMLLMLVLVFAGMQVFSTNSKTVNKTEWYLATKSEGISLYYRWITLGDSIRSREMKAEFTIDAEIPEILSHFSNTESYKNWAAGIKKCSIKKISDSVWFTHTVMNYPWPFKQKDLVTRHLVEQHGLNATIEIEAAPDFFSETNGIERMKNYQGTWFFSVIKNGSTKVDYRVISFTKPIFPRFVQDPIVQKLSIESFVDLKQLAENK